MKISMFWQGPLSLYEEACMRSFVQQGFELWVYSYDTIKLPEGVQSGDARQFLPQELSTAYTQAGQKACLPSFANRFRYQLLQDGGVWMDSDMLCLSGSERFQALIDEAPHQVIVGRQNDEKLNVAALFAPPQHPLLRDLLNEVERRGFVIEQWGMIGPRLLTEYVPKYASETLVLSPSAFYPLPHPEFFKLLLPEHYEECRERCREAYALHLWNEKFRRFCLPQNMLPPEGSYLYEQMLALLGPVAPCLSVETVLRLVQGTQALRRLEQLKPRLAQRLNQILQEL